MYRYEEVSCIEVLSCTDLLNEYELEGKSELMPTIAPDKELYLALENAGLLTFIGAKTLEGELVGFISLLTTRMPHYSKLSSTVESLFVSKKHRKFGTATVLMNGAIKLAQQKGSRILFMSAKKDSILEKFIPRFGLIPTHTSYIKVLDE